MSATPPASIPLPPEPAARRRTALVTGASSGIGRAVAEQLVADGWRVVGAARRTEEIPCGATALALDLTDEDSIERCAQRVHDHGGVDLVVACAGVGDLAPLELTTADEAQAQLQVNLIGPMELIRLLLPDLRQRDGGRIVLVSSVAAAFSSPMAGWYHASKAALEAVSDALRLEVAPFGIEVVVVQPGVVETPWQDQALARLASVTSGTVYASDGGAVADHHRRSAGSPMTTSVTDAAAAIVHAATTRSPRTRYPIGRGSRMAMVIGRTLPDRVFDRLTRSQFGLSGQPER